MNVLYMLLTVRNKESGAVWVTTEKEGTKELVQNFLYGKNLPLIVILTRSPFGSGSYIREI